MKLDEIECVGAEQPELRAKHLELQMKAEGIKTGI